MQGKIAVDAAVGIPAASSWLWMHNFNEILTVILTAGGVVLVILRVIISWREMRRKKD
jgi:hypothetical protein